MAYKLCKTKASNPSSVAVIKYKTIKSHVVSSMADSISPRWRNENYPDMSSSVPVLCYKMILTEQKGAL